MAHLVFMQYGASCQNFMMMTEYYFILLDWPDGNRPDMNSIEKVWSENCTRNWNNQQLVDTIELNDEKLQHVINAINNVSRRTKALKSSKRYFTKY